MVKKEDIVCQGDKGCLEPMADSETMPHVAAEQRRRLDGVRSGDEGLEDMLGVEVGRMAIELSG